MKKIYQPAWLGLIAVAAFTIGSASAQTHLSTGRASLALQTPEALETAHQAFKNGLETAPSDAQLNFFYAATLLAREAHTDSFQQQFTSLNATIIKPSLYELEYSFPLGFANIFMPAEDATTDDHLAYLNSKAALLDQAIASLDKITNDNFLITLTSAETSLLDTKVDYGDVCLLRAGLRLARAALYLANSYNISGEYREFYNLYAVDNLTPQAFLATFPQLFNLSATPNQRLDARAQIQLAHAEWNKALAAIKTKRPVSEGSVLGPIGENEATPFLFAFDSIAAAEAVDVQFDALVLSLSGQQILPASGGEDFYLEGYKINLSPLVTSSASLRSLAPTRFDRGFFRPSSWPDATLGGIFPDATHDDMNDAGNFLFVLQPTIYEPYQFWLLAGNPDEPGYFEDGEVRFNQISGIAVDLNGNIYVADSGNHVIRKISIDNKVTTIAGQKWTNWQERRELEKQYSGFPDRYPSILFVDGPIAVDGNGTVYFVNGNSISKISADGILSNFAGSFSWESPKDGFGIEAAFAGISAMTVDKNGNIFVCDGGAIRKITPAGQVTTIAGKLGWEEGYVEGNGSLARFSDLSGIAVDEAGVIYVMDSNNYVIRKIQPNGTTSTFVGNAIISNHFDAKGSKARLSNPEGLAIDSFGNLYFADANTIRKVKPDGTITSIAGKVGKAGSRATISGQMGILERAGEAAVFGEDDEVTGLAVDRRGTLYASFEDCIYEAESVSSPPSGEPFLVTSSYPAPVQKPSPSPTPDSEPSKVLGLTLATATLDLDNGPIELTFTADTSGPIRYLSLGFSNNSSWIYGGSEFFNTISNPSFLGIIRIPEYSRPGLWSLNSISYTDKNFNQNNLSGIQLETLLGGPLAFEVKNSNPDTAPPILHKLEFLTTEANTSSSSVKIRYRVEVSDDLSGFNYLSISLRQAETNNYIYSHIYNWGSLLKVDGSKYTFEGVVEIPQGSPEGDWAINYITLNDSIGNSQNYYSWDNTLPTDIAILKITTGTGSTNPPEPEDKYHPWVVGFEIEPTAVDVSSADQKVTLRVRVNNDYLPTNTSISADLRKLDENNNWQDQLSIYDFRLVSGSVANGIYEAELVVPKNYKSGNYTLDYLSVYESGSYKRWSRSGSNIQDELRKTLVVSGTADTTAPELKGLTLSNSTVDTRNATATFSANLVITDDMVGLMESNNSWEEGGAIGFSSPSGEGYAWAQIFRANRISGTSSNGTYQVQFELPQFSEEGTWTLDYIELRDANNNTRYLVPANLQADGITVPTLTVLGHPRGWEQQSFTTATSSKGNATIQLGNLTHTYDGTEKVASVTTTPGNLTQSITLTYDGVTAPPTAPGNYTVVAFMNDPNYTGRQVGTMTIAKLNQTIGAFREIGDKVFGAAPFIVTGPVSSSSLPVVLSVKSGPATISGNNTLTLTGAGTVVLAANQVGNETYSAAEEITTSFNVSNPPPPPASGGGGGGGAPSGGGGGSLEIKKSKKGGSKGNSSALKKSEKSKSSKKSSGKKSGGSDSKKSGGKKKSKK